MIIEINWQALVLALIIGILGFFLITRDRVPELSIVMTPNEGVISFQITLTVNDFGSDAFYTFKASDGETITGANRQVTMVVSKIGWSVEVIARHKSGQEKSRTVSPKTKENPNHPPIAYFLPIYPNPCAYVFQAQQLIRINWTYYEKPGCYGIEGKYGIHDPDGDSLKYRMWIENGDDVYQYQIVPGGVWRPRMTKVWTSDPAFFWIVGHTGVSPPYPFAPQSLDVDASSDADPVKVLSVEDIVGALEDSTISPKCGATCPPEPLTPSDGKTTRIYIEVDDGHYVLTFHYSVKVMPGC